MADGPSLQQGLTNLERIAALVEKGLSSLTPKDCAQLRFPPPPGSSAAIADKTGLSGNAQPDPVKEAKSQDSKAANRLEDTVAQAVRQRDFAYGLTTLDEAKAILGEPNEKVQNPASRTLEFRYGTVVLTFEQRDRDKPFVLANVESNGERLPIGRGEPLRPRSTADLQNIDRYLGLEGARLDHLDLRDQGAVLAELPFDNRTVWPSADKLPPGFSPQTILEQGKNPGLGIRDLQSQGLNGAGVHMAVIDMPLASHGEYKQPVQYEPGAAAGMPAHFHGPAVMTFANGQNCGVAPKADVSYFAIPNGATNEHHTAALKKIIEWNTNHPHDKIQVVNVSWGAYPQLPGYQEWVKTLTEAEKQGIFVSTGDCVRTAGWKGPSLSFDILGRPSAANPENPESYFRVPERNTATEAQLLVPGGCRTMASETGSNVYRFDPNGGVSWGAPYIAGLGALALQVNPRISPEQIRTLLVDTATHTDVGPIVNPKEFIARVKEQ
jgi:hypothetical protein